MIVENQVGAHSLPSTGEGGVDPIRCEHRPGHVGVDEGSRGQNTEALKKVTVSAVFICGPAAMTVGIREAVRTRIGSTDEDVQHVDR